MVRRELSKIDEFRYIMAGVLLISAAVISIVVGGIFYAFSKAKLEGKRRKDETRRRISIPMTTLTRITLEDKSQ